MEQVKIGVPIFLYGDIHSVMNKTFSYLNNLQKQHCIKRILFIDTIDCLNSGSNLNDPAGANELFKNIYCIKADTPYALFSSLNESEAFIKDHAIEAMVIPSLTYLFKDEKKEEMRQLLYHILTKVKYLTKKNNMITIIGNTPSVDESILYASNLLIYQNTSMA